MTDPTESILWLSFILALALFAVAAGLRAGRRRKQDGGPVALEGEAGGVWPYGAPAEVDPRRRAGVPTWFYRPVDFLWMGFIFVVFAALSLSTAAGGPSDEMRINPEVLVTSMVLQLVLAGLTMSVVWRRLDPVSWLGLRWRTWPVVFLIAPLAVVSIYVVFGALQAAGYMKLMESLGVESMQESVRLLQSTTDPVTLGLMALAAVIVAPVCEELVFRGYLYPAAKRFAGPWVAGICTALVFAAAHGNLMALLPLFLFGGVLVVLYEKTGSLWAPVAAHFCFNGLTVAAQIAVRYYDIPLEAP